MLHIDAFSDQKELHGIDEILTLTVACKAMPLRFRFESPIVHVAGHLVRISFLPLLPVHHRRHQRADVVAVPEDLLSGLDGDLHRIGPQLLACFPFVNLRIHVQRCEELVQRRSGGVHHESVVHSLVGHIAILPFDVRVFFMDLGGHGETGLLLMHRLAHEDPRVLRRQVQEQRAAVLHHGDELLVAHPRGVEENVIAEVTDLIHHLAGIVDAAVICAQLDHRQTHRPLGLRLLRILLGYQRTDVFLAKAMLQDATDRAESIARGLHVHRRRPGQDQSAVIDGLVIVAIKEDNVAGRQDGIQHHFV